MLFSATCEMTRNGDSPKDGGVTVAPGVPSGLEEATPHLKPVSVMLALGADFERV